MNLTKLQKYLERKMEGECRKERYQLPCLKDQTWVCRRDRAGSWKIKPCLVRKQECSCPDRSAFFVRKLGGGDSRSAEEELLLSSEEEPSHQV